MRTSLLVEEGGLAPTLQLIDTIKEESPTATVDEQLIYPELSVIVRNPDGQHSERQTITGLIHLT